MRSHVWNLASPAILTLSGHPFFASKLGSSIPVERCREPPCPEERLPDLSDERIFRCPLALFSDLFPSVGTRATAPRAPTVPRTHGHATHGSRAGHRPQSGCRPSAQHSQPNSRQLTSTPVPASSAVSHARDLRQCPPASHTRFSRQPRRSRRRTTPRPAHVFPENRPPRENGFRHASPRSSREKRILPESCSPPVGDAGSARDARRRPDEE